MLQGMAEPTEHELLRQPPDLSESCGFAASGRESLHHVRKAVRS